MNMVITRIIKNRELRNRIMLCLRFMSDESYLKLMYRLRVGKCLDLTAPKTFTEKIQWLKLHDRNDEYKKMVDKYEFKSFLSEKVGPQYVIPNIGIWDYYDEIPFDKLPNQFVLKCTHDSGGVVICKDKRQFDQKKAKRKINKSLSMNYYYMGREWPYIDIKPRIIAEEFIEDTNDGELRDYKIFCFNGIPKMMFIASNRQGDGDTCFDFFDMEGNHLAIVNGHPNAKEQPHLPIHFEKMKEISAKLSTGVPTMRVDFYEADGKVYVGEVTLYHWSGFKAFQPEKWDRIMGDWLVIK